MEATKKLRKPQILKALEAMNQEKGMRKYDVEYDSFLNRINIEKKFTRILDSYDIMRLSKLAEGHVWHINAFAEKPVFVIEL